MVGLTRRTDVGFVILGRVTPKTIAVRAVFVLPEQRRKGIAEAMMRAVSGYYLGVTPSTVEALESPPAIGLKDEVNLLAVEDGAKRVYKRSGFLLPDEAGDVLTGGVDPDTGYNGWYSSTWGSIELSPEAS